MEDTALPGMTQLVLVGELVVGVDIGISSVRIQGSQGNFIILDEGSVDIHFSL